MSNQQNGFTLIEALITLAIVAVTVTLVLPGFSSTVDRTRTSAALHQLSADMAMARHHAVFKHAQVVVCPRGGQDRCASDGDWTRGWLVFIDPDGNRQPDDADDILRQSDAPGAGDPSLRLVSSRPFLRYQTDGRSAGTNLTVHVCNDGTLAGMIVVNNSGRVRTDRPPQPVPCPFA